MAKKTFFAVTVAAVLFQQQTQAQEMACTAEVFQTCSVCLDQRAAQYNCSLPGLEDFTPGQYAGTTVNYLSFLTDISSPNFPIRAQEFEACTGGKILFSEAANVFEDPVLDLGTKTSRGSEVYDGYFMSYSHFPEVSALNLAEHLNERIRKDNRRLKWEDVLPKVKRMSEFRKDGETKIDFLTYDGDFFVPIIRLDLFEKYDLPLPNTWEEAVENAKFFHGKDLNEDGEPDYGFCHFPRLGAGAWDWWFSEAVYSTWATTDQGEGINQGFFFDADTMEPRIGSGFRHAAEIWKDFWKHGSNCETTNFVDGRCAIGFGPPGCWKSVFLNGVSRKDENNTVVWRPELKSGEYAVPYRFRPFGSLEVVDRTTGEMRPCTPELCPKAEIIPKKGHHGDDDRASLLPLSPLAGKLINRAPFYWSGGLGTLIRKSSAEIKKDLMWDFFVYTNSPDTAVYDVANYKSWLDSWRFSQLLPGDNFLEAGWPREAYEEHASTMQWALSNEANGAFNLRIPGVVKYTRDVVGENMKEFINDELSIDQLADRVAEGWKQTTRQMGTLDQLETYRASLLLDEHSEVELCRLHRELMDERDPSVCRKYDDTSTKVLLPAILAPSVVAAIALFIFAYLDRKRRKADCVWQIEPAELTFGDPPEVLGRGSFGLVLLAEYRGTQVAVKRVIPPRSIRSDKHDSRFTDVEAVHESHPSATSAAHKLSDSANAAMKLSSGSLNPHSSVAHSSMVAVASGVQIHSSNENSRKAGMYQNAKVTDDFGRLKADFKQEMRYLSKLRHPCVTTVMGAVIKGDEPQLVMELMEHGSLYDILQNDTMYLEGDIILPILRDISKGLRFLHAATPQVIHGDLKAQNILVDSRFHAKVADFGLSAKKNLGATGTPFWMAPELLRGETNTTASDAYSFGMILFEVYARQDPYEGEDSQEVLRLVADKTVNKRPSVPLGACPPKIQTLMSECLDGDPAKRPTFEELDLQLKRLDVSDIEPRNKPDRFKDQTKELLNDIFPKHVAKALREGRKVEPESRECVTIFFSDIVGFTSISSTLPPIKVSDMLGRLYSQFDKLSGEDGFDIFKVETIGDAYMCVTNLVKDQPDHAKRIAEFAVAAIQVANRTLIDVDDPSRGCVNIRVGFHSGSVVATVVGERNPRYCLFGDAVNCAARHESTSQSNRIQCSEQSAQLLREQGCNLKLTCRGLVNLKGKGDVTTFWVAAPWVAPPPEEPTTDEPAIELFEV